MRNSARYSLIGMLALLLAAAGSVPRAVAESPWRLRLAPVFEELPADVDAADGPRPWRALGPFVSQNRPKWIDEETMSARFRPLLVFYDKAPFREQGWGSLWPLAVHRESRNQDHTRLLLGYRTEYLHEAEGSLRWGIAPLLWGGRARDGEEYLALFPLGGTIRDVAGYERVRFRLFPYRLSTWYGDDVAHAFFWPFFGFSHHEEEFAKWRVFPLAGAAKRPGYTRRFYFWPFVHTYRNVSEDGDLVEEGRFYFPVAGWSETRGPDGEVVGDSRTALWPFFSRLRSPHLERLHSPWPFYQYEVRPKEDYRRVYYWPLYGTRTVADTFRHRFLLWPFWQDWDMETDAVTIRQRQLFPVYWSSTHEAPDGTRVVYRHLFPVVKYEYGPGYSWGRILSLWPKRNTPGVERNYAPLWTLYSWQRTGEALHHEALWGTFQLDRSRGELTGLYLFPFFDYQATDNAWRLNLGTGILGFGAGAERNIQLLWLLEW